MKIATVALGLLIACCANATALAQAAAFPSRPIRIVVPFPPGGGTDVAARALAYHLQKDLGQPVLVDNRPGGNSVIASEGGGPALAHVLGGQVDLTLVVAANGIAQARTGKVVAIAVTGPARAAVAGDVPTFAESGFPQFVLLNWYSMFAPAGTPREVIDTLNGSIVKGLRTPAVAARIAAVGVDPAPSTPAELDGWLRADIARYRQIIELTGAQPELR